jgi:hypothetical protein
MGQMFSHLLLVSESRVNLSVLHVPFEAWHWSRFSLKHLGCPFLCTDTNASYSTVTMRLVHNLRLQYQGTQPCSIIVIKRKLGLQQAITSRSFWTLQVYFKIHTFFLLRELAKSNRVCVLYMKQFTNSVVTSTSNVLSYLTIINILCYSKHEERSNQCFEHCKWSLRAKYFNS